MVSPDAEEVVGVCFRPTQEETELSEARPAGPAHEERRDPWRFPEPRGNQDRDDREVDRSMEKLEAVLGH